jgi:hypothetical protein
MTIRTTRRSITFSAPFHLPGFETPLPAGTYVVKTDEEELEGNDHTAFRRTATTMRIQRGAGIEHHPVEPEHLDAALERDHRAAREVVIPSSPVPPPTNWRWVPLWVRNNHADGNR